MQDSNKSNPSDSDDDNFTYFDELLPYYRSIGWTPSRFRRKHTTTFEKIIEHKNKALNFINRIKLKKLDCENRAKSIPENATIRKEYVKCGKEICEEKHGPYYYAYWKDPDNKKLKKKYIGTYLPTKDKP